jgi:hypothetical protein
MIPRWRTATRACCRQVFPIPNLHYTYPIQIARKILYGRTALLNGKKSPMAREVFSTHWGVKCVTAHFIAIVAYMVSLQVSLVIAINSSQAFFILSGEETLAHAPNTIEVFWDHLDTLLRVQKGTTTFFDDLIEFWNLELGIKDASRKKEINKGKAALLRAFGG